MTSRWTAAQMGDQEGKTFMVTGANTGVGLETAKALSEHGARVFMACRNRPKGEAARDEVERMAAAAKPVLVVLDLADLSTLREAAATVADSTEQLDVLINNAAVMVVPNQPTQDGFEPHLGTNYFGHYALTGLLLDVLQRSPAPRVVTVGSLAARTPGTRMRWDDLQWQRSRYRAYWAYSRSKLATLAFAAEFNRRTQQSGRPLLSVAAHPGGSLTELFRYNRLGVAVVSTVVRPLIQPTVNMAALPSLYAATADGLVGGQYIGPDGLLGLRGHPVAISMTKAESDAETGRRLWDISEELTGVCYHWSVRVHPDSPNTSD